MAATGASHRCCCRRHAGSHKEEVGLRQLKEEVGLEQILESEDCGEIGSSLWELPWQRLAQAIGAAVAGMPAPTRTMWDCGE